MLGAAVLCGMLVSASPSTITDAVLVDGYLSGTVAPGESITIVRSGQVIAATHCNEVGEFRVAIRPGVYVVAAGTTRIVCRVWSDGTAPPAAKPLVIPCSTVVRGQFGGRGLVGRLDAAMQPAIIVTGIGLTVWSVLDPAS